MAVQEVQGLGILLDWLITGVTASTRTQVVCASYTHHLSCGHRPQGSIKVTVAVPGIEPGHNNIHRKGRETDPSCCCIIGHFPHKPQQSSAHASLVP